MSAIDLTSMNSGFKAPIKHAALVAGADHAHADGRTDGLVVAEVESAQACAGHGGGGDARLEKVAAGDFRGIAHAFRPSVVLHLPDLQQKGLIRQLWRKKSNPVQRPRDVEAITNSAIISTKSLVTSRAWPICAGSSG